MLFRSPNEKLLKFTVRSDADYRSARQISDLTALGLYYSNRGSELIADGDLGEARQWLEIAVRLAPHLPGSWVNLGVALRRSGDLEIGRASCRERVSISVGAVSLKKQEQWDFSSYYRFAYSCCRKSLFPAPRVFRSASYSFVSSSFFSPPLRL